MQAVENRAITVIDIEHWPVMGKPSVVQESVRKYLQVLEWFKQSAKGIQVGYYGVAPIRDYWRAVKGQAHRDYKAWQTQNNAVRPVADAVDALFPSIYTFYADQKGWKRYAAAQIREARRLAPDKPVYAFLWPVYHNSNRFLRGQYIPADYWRMQLEFLRPIADGVVLWGGYKKPWNGNMAWWHETRQFLATHFQIKR